LRSYATASASVPSFPSGVADVRTNLRPPSGVVKHTTGDRLPWVRCATHGYPLRPLRGQMPRGLCCRTIPSKLRLVRWEAEPREERRSLAEPGNERRCTGGASCTRERRHVTSMNVSGEHRRSMASGPRHLGRRDVDSPSRVPPRGLRERTPYRGHPVADKRGMTGSARGVG